MRSAVVVGSGIAGLAIAEILVRNEWRVTVVEKEPYLGGDASLRTQNWLHTGWLYASLPDPSAMTGCSLSRTWALHLYGEQIDWWWRGEPLLYAFATRAREMLPVERAAWRQYLRYGPLRRLRGLGYPTDPIDWPQPPAFDEQAARLRNLQGLMDAWEGRSYEGPEAYMTIRSTDRAGMDTGLILRTLAANLGDAEVVTSARARVMSDRAVAAAGWTVKADLVIVAAGAGIPDAVVPYGSGALAGKFESVVSPIAVVSPALPLPSFIRFTPHLDWTINHVRYQTPSGTVSTIGSWDHARFGDPPDVEAFLTKVEALAGVRRRGISGTYLGTKTEFTKGNGRRYNHAIAELSDGVFAVVPGKFSQFPLLVGELAERLGLDTKRPMVGGADHSAKVAPTAADDIAAAARYVAA